MYYPNLMNMNKNHWIRKREIKLLDEWLVRIPYRNRKNINFLNFSIDEDINEELALRLFIGATEESVRVLNLYYNVVTDNKMHHLKRFTSKKDIPKTIYDYDSENEILVKDSNIEVRFEVIDFPKNTFSADSEAHKKVAGRLPTVENVKSFLNHEEFNSIFK